MASTIDVSLDSAPLAGTTRPELPRTASPPGRFILGWMLAWALVGCAVAVGSVFAAGVDLWPAIRLSVSFAEVVGLTAFTSARLVFPLFVRLPFGLRLILQLSTTLSATVFGSAVVIWLQPLFSLAQLRNVLLIVLVNAVLAAVVGIALSTYDQMKQQIESSYEALRKKEALEREVSIARDVQRQLLPRVVPDIPGLELAGVCQSAVGVGGDYYDYVRAGDDRLGLVIADVSGKGIPAALLMAGLQASVRSLFQPTTDPAPLNVRLNDNLFRSSSDARYATMFLGCYDVGTRTLCYSNAGHHPPLLLHGDAVHRLKEGGMPVGLFEGASYREGRHRLESGDLLAMFTDGVVETPNADGEEFGEHRLIRLLRRHRPRPLREIIESCLDELRVWSEDAEPHDDVTLVLARVR